MRAMAIRYVLWGSVVIYLGLDLFAFNGPLKQKIEAGKVGSTESVIKDKALGIVARAYAQPIYRSQVDRAVEIALFREGRLVSSVSEEELGWRRVAAANELLDEALLRNKITYNLADYPISDQDIDAELARFTKRFPDQQSLESALEGQQYDGMKELRYRVAARLQQEQYLNEKISSASVVTEEEARSFYETYKKDFTVPMQREVRHIFFEQLDRGEAAARHLAEKTWKRLRAGADFASVASQISDDPQSKLRGGALGWISGERIDQDFVNTVMAMNEADPKIVVSKIGFHIVEVIDQKKQRIPSFEEVRADVIAAIQLDRKKLAVKAYRAQLRKQAGKYAVVFIESLLN